MKRIFSLLLVLAMVLGMAVVGISAEAKTFPDVQEGKWYYESVMEAAELGLMQGNADGTFAPTASITRAQMVILVARFAGVDYENYPTTKKFKDVGLTNWYSGAICWASDEGLVNGISATEFAPNKNITRQELAKLIIGLIDYLDVYVPDATDAIAKFADKNSIAKWAKDYVEALRKTGLVKGDSNGNFNPTSNTTRAEVSTLVVRLNPYINPAEDDVNLIMQQFAAGVCDTHNHYHVTLGYNSAFTAENWETYIHTWMGLDGDDGRYVIEVDEADVEAVKEGYSGQGVGAASGGEINIKLTDTVSGKATEWTPVTFYCTKFPDAAGEMFVCPEDYAAADYINNLEDYFELDNDGRLKIALGGGATFTKEIISEKMITALGLSPRQFEIVFEDDDEFESARVGHCGLCHGQVHDEYLDIAIRNKVDSAFHQKDIQTEYVEARFWFSKDVTEVYRSCFPEDGAKYVYSDDLTEGAFESFMLAKMKDYDGMLGDFSKVVVADFAKVAEELEANGTASVTMDFVIPTDTFTFGNMAELPDTVITKTFTIVVPAKVVDYGTAPQVKIDLKKVDSSLVKKDGVISTGEYFEIVTSNATTVAKPGSKDYKTDVKFYVSWDEENGVNFAAEVTADKFAQTVEYEGGRMVGDDSIIAGTSFVFNSMFNRPGDYATGVYYAVSKSTDDGTYNEGTYAGQIGSPFNDILPELDPVAGTDYVITYEGNKAIVEWSIPFAYVAPTSVKLEDGAEFAFTFAALNGEGNSWDSANTVYATGIGQMVPFADGKDQVHAAILVLKDYGTFETVTDNGTAPQVKIDLKKVDSSAVKKDGVITAGEYYAVETANATTVVKPSSKDYKTDVKFYVSWDEKNGVNFAAEVTADKFAQTVEYEGGRMVGDDSIIAGTSFVFNSMFNRPGDYATGVYYAVSKSTDDGTYNEGTYAGQIGSPFTDIFPELDPVAGTDYVITYNGNKAIIEWSIPFAYVAPTSVKLEDGAEFAFTFAALNGEGNSWDSANTVYATGIGQMVPFADGKDQVHAAILVLKDYGTFETVTDIGTAPQVKLDLKKVDSSAVKKDGFISAGEYYAVETANATTVKKAGSKDYTTDVKFYVSWDEENGVNFAAEMTADKFAQTLEFEGGRTVGDDAIIAGTSFVFNSMFNQPGNYATGVYYAIARSTDDGSYSEGTYAGQIGSPFNAEIPDYDPVAGKDYVISYNGNKVVVEWSVPFAYVAPSTVALENGAEFAFTFAALNGQGIGWDGANSVCATGIGQMVPFADGKDQVHAAVLVLNK